MHSEPDNYFSLALPLTAGVHEILSRIARDLVAVRNEVLRSSSTPRESAAHAELTNVSLLLESLLSANDAAIADALRCGGHTRVTIVTQKAIDNG